MKLEGKKKGKNRNVINEIPIQGSILLKMQEEIVGNRIFSTLEQL